MPKEFEKYIEKNFSNKEKSNFFNKKTQKFSTNFEKFYCSNDEYLIEYKQKLIEEAQMAAKMLQGLSYNDKKIQPSNNAKTYETKKSHYLNEFSKEELVKVREQQEMALAKESLGDSFEADAINSVILDNNKHEAILAKTLEKLSELDNPSICPDEIKKILINSIIETRSVLGLETNIKDAEKILNKVSLDLSKNEKVNEISNDQNDRRSYLAPFISLSIVFSLIASFYFYLKFIG